MSRANRTWAVVLCAALIPACGLSPADDQADDPTGTEADAVTASGGLTPAQRAGQRIIYSYRGLTPPPELFDRIRAGEVAGVHFWSENVASPDQLRSVLTDLQKAQQASPIRSRLLLITDQEGGPSRALPGGPELTEKQVGQAHNAVVLAWQAGGEAAHSLRDVGMNVNLAPVLDVFRTPGNFIDQAGRSYNQDPNVVRVLGPTSILAQRQDGIVAGAKHFPGLGSARVDQNTDEAPVQLDVSRAELRRVDEAPYVTAIAAGVRLIMMSWATYTSLDPDRPAGISPIVQQELRGHLGFRGVTISDTLIAGSLDPFGTVGQRSVLAAQAGTDLLLCSFSDVAICDEAKDGLTAAIESGELDRASFDASLRRITALRDDVVP